MPASTHIALLRGINVGGHRQVGMTDLRNFLSSLGFENPRSLLQSGNVVLESKTRTGAELERFLEAEALKRFEMEIDFFVRTAVEWKSIVRQNPFRKEGEGDPGRLIVHFLKSAADAEDIEALKGDIKGPEIVKAKGRQAYIFYPDGQGRSRLTNAVIERRIGRATGRNWNTVLKLAILSKSGSTVLTPITPRRKIS